uniref:Uncharacterized protein n=1 Tax=Cacopsylla melanoneura TaxID=428564 RepID=A0A8D9E728_9HEMI
MFRSRCSRARTLLFRAFRRATVSRARAAIRQIWETVSRNPPIFQRGETVLILIPLTTILSSLSFSTTMFLSLFDSVLFLPWFDSFLRISMALLSSSRSSFSSFLIDSMILSFLDSLMLS